MEMPEVQSCDVLECAYNKQRQCHALAITVGDSGKPRCETFWAGKGGSSESDAGDSSKTSHVGACHTSDCEYNERLQCSAPGIRVGYQNENPNCLTYEPSLVQSSI
ncbi:MAG: DUF1540 domain-containing protein [Planctomycetaceae bacterium]|nr:DUF1540 domain-containing protein [Planctomycetaceae bacterium]